MTTQKVRNLAAKSAAEIRQRGWHQGDYGNGIDEATCKVCLLGVINAALTGDPWNDDVESGGLIAELASRTGSDYPHIWNDVQGRTVDEVLAVLDAIAAGE